MSFMGPAVGEGVNILHLYKYVLSSPIMGMANIYAYNSHNLYLTVINYLAVL